MMPLDSERGSGTVPITDAPTEREKWDAERSDHKIDQSQKDREIEAKLIELRRSRLSSPLTVAIIAAAVAAGGNAYVAHQNGYEQRGLEDGKAEAARILEAIKAPDPDKAAANLDFLLGTGLIADDKRRQDIGTYLRNRRGGQGASIQASAPPVAPTPPPTVPDHPTLPPTLPSLPATAETVSYQTGWLDGGHNQAEACQKGLTDLGPKYPGKKLSPINSSEVSNKDLFGHVTYNYSCVYRITAS